MPFCKGLLIAFISLDSNHKYDLCKYDLAVLATEYLLENGFESNDQTIIESLTFEPVSSYGYMKVYEQIAV